MCLWGHGRDEGISSEEGHALDA
jgi:hypothetical protein